MSGSSYQLQEAMTLVVTPIALQAVAVIVPMPQKVSQQWVLVSV